MGEKKWWTAVIIDDEKPGRDHLEKLLNRVCPEIKVVATADSALRGLEIIQTHQPQIVFLDVQMPGESGFDLLERLEDRDFALIFVTAFEEHALKAIKARTIDYLLKPLDIDELIQAVENARQFLGAPSGSSEESDSIPAPTPMIQIPTPTGIRVVKLEEIVYLEAKNNYTFIHLTSKKTGLMLAKNLGQMERELPEGHFFRSHKSFLVNIQAIKEYNRDDNFALVMNNGDKVRLARRKKAALKSRLSGNS